MTIQYKLSKDFYRLQILPRDAVQSAVMPQQVVRPNASVRLSICDVQVCFSHRLEYFENNFKAD